MAAAQPSAAIPAPPLVNPSTSMDTELPAYSPIISSGSDLHSDPRPSYTSQKRRRLSDPETSAFSLPQQTPFYPPSQPGPSGFPYLASSEFNPQFKLGPSDAGPSWLPSQQIPSHPLSHPNPQYPESFFPSVSVTPFVHTSRHQGACFKRS